MSLFTKFVKQVSYPLINRREGIRGLYGHLRVLEDTQYLPLAELLQLQWKRLQRILVHSYENTSFYRTTFELAGLNPHNLNGPEGLKRLPILTKEVVRANLPQMLARNFSPSELHYSETGGTTGVKIGFYRDNYCLSPKKAATIRHERWTGWDIGERVGLIWPASQDYVGSNTFRAKIKNSLSDRYLVLPAAVLQDRDIHEYYFQLRRHRPTMLRCFPYSLNLVAKYILANHLDCLTVKGIITTGELLYDHQRNCLEKAFSCKVFNSYGSRETGLIAQECNQHDGLHMNMESLFIEFLDSSGAPVREGELGQIVVTDLLNFGMPLIRYQIDDFGTFSTRTCRCGRSLPLMEDIRGRVVDEIIVPDGRKVSASTLVLYLVDNGPPVGQVQIVQEELDHFRILLTKDPLPDERVFTYYESTAKRLLGDSVRISFDLVDGIPKEPSGKYRFVKSRIKH